MGLFLQGRISETQRGCNAKLFSLTTREREGSRLRQDRYQNSTHISQLIISDYDVRYPIIIAFLFIDPFTIPEPQERRGSLGWLDKLKETD
jgi:hypothetical protein